MGKQTVWQAAEKFSPKDTYTNISVLWIFYYRYVLRILYVVHIPHEVVTLTSIACGGIAAWSIGVDKLWMAAVFLHAKDVFDACDGALSRLTNRSHQIGRFMDSLGDCAVISAVTAVIAYTAWPARHHSYALFWFLASELSIFLQCSYFNYYQIRYTHRLRDRRLTRQVDETSASGGDERIHHPLLIIFLNVLKVVYRIVYGWQDRCIERLDVWLKKNAGIQPGSGREAEWYEKKKFLVYNSALCFGTHIFVMIIACLMQRPVWALYFIVIGINLYWMGIIVYKITYFKE